MKTQKTTVEITLGDFQPTSQTAKGFLMKCPGLIDAGSMIPFTVKNHLGQWFPGLAFPSMTGTFVNVGMVVLDGGAMPKAKIASIWRHQEDMVRKLVAQKFKDEVERSRVGDGHAIAPLTTPRP
jgi:hypothetical protein